MTFNFFKKIREFFSLSIRIRKMHDKLVSKSYSLEWYAHDLSKAKEELLEIWSNQTQARKELAETKRRIADLWRISEKDAPKFYTWLEKNL